MGEKRFILDDESRIWDNGDVMTALDIVFMLNEQEDTIFKLQDLCGKSDGKNAKLRIENKMLEKEVNLLRPTNLEQYEQIQKLQEENEQLHHELQQTKEYLQIKIDECKNHKKMKEIVFGVEQAVGYEKALLQFQKGLKRRLNDE